jgi:hypothetical protein
VRPLPLRGPLGHYRKLRDTLLASEHGTPRAPGSDVRQALEGEIRGSPGNGFSWLSPPSASGRRHSGRVDPVGAEALVVKANGGCASALRVTAVRLHPADTGRHHALLTDRVQWS